MQTHAKGRALAPVLYLALLLAVLFAGDRLGGAVLAHWVDRSEFRFSKLYRGGINADILAIGDSRAVHSVYAPAIGKDTCMSVFNAAFNGMSTEIAAAIVDDYLAHNRPPKAVLIEISNVGEDAGLLSEMRLYARHQGAVRALVDRLDPRQIFWGRFSHLYAFNNEMTLRALYYERAGDQDWVLDDTVTKDAIAHTDWQSYAAWRPRAANVAALKRLVAELKGRGIDPVLFIAPYHPMHARMVPEFARRIAALERDLGPDTPVLDLSTRLTSGRYFADVVHPNIAGALALAPILSRRVLAAPGVSPARDCGGAAAPPERTAEE
jgi:hypothetical protein